MHNTQRRSKHRTSRRSTVIRFINRFLMIVHIVWGCLTAQFYHAIMSELEYKYRQFNRKYKLTEIITNEQDSDRGGQNSLR